MKLVNKLIVLISTISFSFSAYAVDKSFPNDKVTIWGDFSGVTLQVKLIGGAPYEPLYQEMIPIWEEKTGGKVEILSKKSHFELDKEIKQDIAAGDLGWCVGSNHTSFAPQYGDIYADLNGIISADYLAEFTPLILEHSTYNNKLVQLPQHSDVSNLFYIKSLYEDNDNQKNFKSEYGYDLTPPVTWDQVKDQAIFFADPPNFYGTQYVGKEEAITGRFYEMLIAEGGSLFDDNWNPTFNDEAGQRALAWFKDLYDAKAVPAGVMNYLWDETGLGFASGTVAMNLDWGGWAAFFNGADSKISGDVGVIRAPLGSGGKRTGWSGSHTYSITNECPNKKAAASFIWILTNHEAQMHEARSGKLPTMPKVWDAIAKEMNDTGNVFMAEVFSTFKTSMAEDAVTPPLIPEWIPFSNIIFPELQKAILGDKSIKDALDYAAKETAYMMEDAGY